MVTGWANSEPKSSSSGGFQSVPLVASMARVWSSCASVGTGFTTSWQFAIPRATWMDKGTLNFSYDRLRFKYDDFRDLRVLARTPGTEPLYVLDADVMQFFLSIWF